LPLENIRPPSSGERGHLAVEFMGSLRPIWELPAVPAMAVIFVGHGDGACEEPAEGGKHLGLGNQQLEKPRRRRIEVDFLGRDNIVEDESREK
jgi:hypothetical protein